LSHVVDGDAQVHGLLGQHELSARKSIYEASAVRQLTDRPPRCLRHRHSQSTARFLVLRPACANASARRQKALGRRAEGRRRASRPTATEGLRRAVGRPASRRLKNTQSEIPRCARNDTLDEADPGRWPGLCLFAPSELSRATRLQAQDGPLTRQSQWRICATPLALARQSSDAFLAEHKGQEWERCFWPTTHRFTARAP